jgi:hypothetical protein
LNDNSDGENDKEAVSETVVSGAVPDRRRLFRSLVALAGLGITGALLSQDKVVLPRAHAADMVIDANNVGSGTTSLFSTGSPPFSVGGGNGGNLQEWLNDNGGFELVPFSFMDYQGYLTLGRGTGTGILSNETDAGILIQGLGTSNGACDLGLRISNTTAGGVEWYIDSTGSDGTHTSAYGPGSLVFVRRAGGGYLFDRPLMTLFSTDDFNAVGINTTTPSAVVHAVSSDIGAVVMAAQAASGQFADLQEWQDSSGNLLTRVDADGNLGIHDLGSWETILGYGLQVGNVGATDSSIVLATEGPMVSVGKGSNNRRALVVQGRDANILSAPAKISAYDYGTGTGRPLSINPDNSNVYLAQNGGKVGIGTGSPLYGLDLRTPGASAAQMHIAPSDNDSGGYLTSANAGNLFMAGGAAWNGSSWVAKSSTSYQYGGGPAGVRFFFDTGLTVGSTYTPTTRMFIGPTGNVGIGMSTAPKHLLQLGLDDAAKPGSAQWTVASDGRLKDPESIQPFTEGSEFIKRLPQPVWFRYRKDSGLPSDPPVAGWIAQDVAPVAPFMIRITKQKLRDSDLEDTDTLSLNTNELPYALVNSVREILDRIEEIGRENAEMLQREEEGLSRLKEKDREVAEILKRLEEKDRENAELKTRINSLEHPMNSNN